MKVALIGDSIRLRSERFVRQYLPPKFQVDSPKVNCKSSQNVAASIRDWVRPATFDLVHINCGLHDIRHDPGHLQAVSSLEEYLANLRRVFLYLGDIGVSVIWATSTPVNENMHGNTAMPRWYRADLVEYNRCSVDLARSFGFRINDLYRQLSEASVEAWFLPDGVHFNPAGNALIGEYVAAAIQDAAIDRTRPPRGFD